MRLAHTLGYLAARYGGPPQCAIALGQSLRRLGADVDWWATASAPEREELAYLGDAAHLYDATVPHWWFRSPQLTAALARAGRAYDLFHLHQLWDYPLFAAYRQCRRLGIPYVVSPHGILNAKWRYTNSLKKRIYFRLVGRPLLEHAACIHVLSEHELQGLCEVGLQTPRAVVPNGIDPEQFAHLPDPLAADRRWPSLQGRLVVLFLGRLSPEKGLGRLVPAWSHVVREQPHALLMIAGPDHRGHRAAVEALVKSAGLSEHVFMPGMLGGEEKMLALSRADVYVQPSHAEGFSVAVLEAMASAKPCVITTACNFPELAAAGAGEVVAPTEHELAAALLRLCSLSAAERQEIGARGRALVMRQYTWEAVAHQMLTVYRCILGGEPVPLHPTPSN